MPLFLLCGLSLIRFASGAYPAEALGGLVHCRPNDATGLLCDPNHVLLESRAMQINAILHSMRMAEGSYVSSPCSNVSIAEPSGYRVAVAVARQAYVTGMMVYPLWHLNSPNCNNGLLLWINYSNTTVEVHLVYNKGDPPMPPQSAEAIVDAMLPALQSGTLDVAIVQAIEDIGHILAGQRLLVTGGSRPAVSSRLSAPKTVAQALDMLWEQFKTGYDDSFDSSFGIGFVYGVIRGIQMRIGGAILLVLLVSTIPSWWAARKYHRYALAMQQNFEEACQKGRYCCDTCPMCLCKPRTGPATTASSLRKNVRAASRRRFYDVATSIEQDSYLAGSNAMLPLEIESCPEQETLLLTQACLPSRTSTVPFACGHTLCGSCLSRGQDSEVNCPICTSETAGDDVETGYTISASNPDGSPPSLNAVEAETLFRIASLNRKWSFLLQRYGLMRHIGRISSIEDLIMLQKIEYHIDTSPSAIFSLFNLWFLDRHPEVRMPRRIRGKELASGLVPSTAASPDTDVSRDLTSDFRTLPIPSPFIEATYTSQAFSVTGSQGTQTSAGKELPSLQLGARPNSPGDELMSQVQLEALLTKRHWKLDIGDLCIQLQDGQPIVLGRGGFGVVFAGTLKDQEVAIKVVRRQSSKQQADFLREVRLLKETPAPNIVRFLAATEDGPLMLMVMELMAGGSLGEQISRDYSGSLLWRNRGQRVALDIAEGIHALHSRRVGHNDLKPGNILLTADLTAKIGDVGLSKLMTGTGKTFTGGGTWDYASPEQVQGCHSCMLKSDIWSFGTILWVICTGEFPSRGQLRPLRVPEEAPTLIQHIITQCLEVEAKHRPTISQIIAIFKRLSKTGAPLR